MHRRNTAQFRIDLRDKGTQLQLLGKLACIEIANRAGLNLRWIDLRIVDRLFAGFQLVQQKLVWMAQEITKAQLLALRLTRMMEMGSARPAKISLAKRNNVWMALECARKARDILGAAGITDRYPVIRHVLNLETVSTYEGTHDIHTLVVGRDITGINAFGG